MPILRASIPLIMATFLGSKRRSLPAGKHC